MPNPMQRERNLVERQIAGALRSVIMDKGAIDLADTGSAAKRVYGILFGGASNGGDGTSPRVRIDEMKLPGKVVVLRPGDRVDIAPSQPGKRDGWVGTILDMFRDPGGDTLEVTHPSSSARYVKIDQVKGRKRK